MQRDSASVKNREQPGTRSFVRLLLVSVALLSMSCQSPKPHPVGLRPTGKPSPQSAPLVQAPSDGRSRSPVRSFPARGEIRALGPGGQTVIVHCEEVPGFLPKTTMEFALRETNAVRGLTIGSAVTFRIATDEQESWIEALRPIDRDARAAGSR